MAYLKFNKAELVNLEYSLKREFLASNHAGGYTYTTISGCNTRKYHGLLIVPLKQFGDEKHVLLSSLDETLIQHQKEFNLGIHRYGDIYEPRGHKYIVDFEVDKCVALTYRVGGMVLRKVMLLAYNKEQIFIQYTLLEAHSPTIMRLKPFLAFRNIHNLSKANTSANTKYKEVAKGRSFCMYQGFPELSLQLNTDSEFISNPDWYYNVEYKEESRRAFESKEDLFVPGYFEFPLKKGQTVLFSASINEEKPTRFNQEFLKHMSARRHRDSYENTLKITAKQFIMEREGKTSIYAGYPWLDKNLRDTLIAAPGLTYYADGDLDTFRAVIDTIVKHEADKLTGDTIQPDVSLWFFWTLQQYAKACGNSAEVWKRYKNIMKAVLGSYCDCSRNRVTMHETGLLWAEEPGKALSWMDAYVGGKPVTERAGYQVELNSLWYNAICFIIELAEAAADTKTVNNWIWVKKAIEKNFSKAFWIESQETLADYVGPEGQNRFCRPNQMFTCAFDYSPISDEHKAKILQNVTKELLTSRGLRTLSPMNPSYKSEYDGDQTSRDLAYHQGTTRVWLLGFYIEASLKLYGKSFIRKAEELVQAFEEDMNVHCIGSISEVYDGDPPHQPHGCPSYSNSVAEILRSIKLIEQYKNLVL